MKIQKNMLLAAAVAGLSGGSAFGAISFTGTSYTENFDTLGATATAQFSSTAGTQNTIPGLTTWDGVKVSGTGTAGMNFTLDNGNANSGAIYNYGTTSATDRALGALASGTNVPAFGVQITNNASGPVTSFTLTYTSEQWRSSTSTTNSLAFAYGSDSTFGTATSSGYLTAATLTAVTVLNAPGKPFVTPTNAATDGNVTANQTSVSSTVTLPSPLPVGKSLFIRWTDTNDVGNDAGIAVDDLTFTATVASTSSAFATVTDTATGASLGSVTVTGGSGSYALQNLNVAGAKLGSVGIGGDLAIGSDPIWIYLDLTNNGDLAALQAASLGGTVESTSLTLGGITYDALLKYTNPVGTTDAFSFDFSSLGTGGIGVNNIGVVPEPTTLVGAVGLVGLTLLRRRSRKA